MISWPLLPEGASESAWCGRGFISEVGEAGKGYGWMNGWNNELGPGAGIGKIGALKYAPGPNPPADCNPST